VGGPQGRAAVVPLSTGKAFLVIGRQEIDKTKVRKWILVASSKRSTSGRARIKNQIFKFHKICPAPDYFEVPFLVPRGYCHG
jgi:hypothetical protein